MDPRAYDYTKDWAQYWVARIQVYYNKALQACNTHISKLYIF